MLKNLRDVRLSTHFKNEWIGQFSKFFLAFLSFCKLIKIIGFISVIKILLLSFSHLLLSIIELFYII